MLTRHSRAWPRGSAPAPPPAHGGDILLRRVAHQAKAAWLRRKMRVCSQGAIRRRGAEPGAGTEDAMRWSVAGASGAAHDQENQLVVTRRTCNPRTKRTCIAL